MKVLAINSSAGKDGNTAILINTVFEELNREANLFQYKAGAAITAARRGGALNALDAMNHFFMLQNMFVVGSSYWPMAYGQKPGDVRQDEEGLGTIRRLGQNMEYLLKSLEKGEKA